MEPSTIGTWAFLVMGIVMCATGLVKLLRGGAPSVGLVLLMVFGVLMLGVATFGVAFIDPYASFVKTIKSVASVPSDSTYAAAVGKVASGALTGEYRDIVLQYIVEHPVDGTEDLLRHASSAAKDPEVKASFMRSIAVVSQRQATAETLAAALVGDPAASTKLANFDPTTRALVARVLSRQPRGTLEQLNIPPGQLLQMARIQPFQGGPE